MNLSKLRLTLFSICFSVCMAPVAYAQTDFKAAARKVLETNNSKVFGVKSLVKLEASFQGKQVINREMPAFGIGTVIADGILVVSYRTIKPKASANVQGLAQAQSRGISVETEVKEIKLISESGEEFDANLVLHDADLDLAFVALDRKSENADSWSCDPVNIEDDVELAHLDDVVFLSRAGESMRFQTSIRVGQVNTIIKRPRKLYSVNSLVLGGASFNLDGKYVGMGIRKTSGTGSEFSAVLPAKYIRKLLPQAIEKAKTVEAEKEANVDAEEEAATEDEVEESDDDSDQNDDGGGDVDSPSSVS